MQHCFAQKEADQWRFGLKAGLSFQFGAPLPVSSSNALNQYCSSGISDSLGNLQFYVRDAYLIYNNNNDTMSNGLNIGGNTCLNGSVVIPKGGKKYYVIVHNSFHYFFSSPILPMLNFAVVDMNLSSGMGSVTVSNLPITPTGTAITNKLAATKHCNKKDHWILTHVGGYPGSRNYYAYLVTSLGISASPVISTIGSNQTQAYFPGHQNEYWTHKFSPNGRKLCAVFPYRTVELYDFDNASGVLSNVIKIDSIPVAGSNYTLNPMAVCVEFSPDGSKLYVSYTNVNSTPNKHPYLCQFDLCAGSATDIAASKTVLSYDTISRPIYADLQLGPDGKIYIGTPTNSLHVINSPNAPGTACNYSALAVSLGTVPGTQSLAICYGSLPKFVSSYFEQKPALPAISGSLICGNVSFSAPLALCAAAGYSVTSKVWNFGDPLSGINNTSGNTNPNHTFSANGIYVVKLLLYYYPCGVDTLKQTVTISGLPGLGLQTKNTMCRGESAVMSFSGASSYSFNGVAIAQNSTVVQPTITTVYTLSGTDSGSGCRSSKAITLTVLPCTNMANLDQKEVGALIFPNPGTGKFTIEGDFKKAEYQIFDQLGVLVLRGSLIAGKTDIDLSEEANGIYFVELKMGTQMQVMKLVKTE